MKKTYNVPAEFQPISMWGYFGYSILFSIPFVGFIFILIFSFGSKNVNKRNFARSNFCVLILVLLIFGIITLIGFLTGGANAILQWFQSIGK